MAVLAAVLGVAALRVLPVVLLLVPALLPQVLLRLQVFRLLLAQPQRAHSVALLLLPLVRQLRPCYRGCMCMCSTARPRIRLRFRLLLQHLAQELPADSDRLPVVAPVVRQRHRLRLRARW